jgi:translation initiation factor 3 subunit I
MVAPAGNCGKAPRSSITAPKGRITRVLWTDCNRSLLTSHDGGFVSG